MAYAILIIEDEATLAKNIVTYLQRYGYEARAAMSAEEGLAQIDSYKPDDPREPEPEPETEIEYPGYASVIRA